MLAHDRPDAGEQVYEEAVTLHQQERWDDAAAAFLEAAEAGYREEVSLYNAACGYARMGQTVQAIELIERSLEAGLGDFELISRDADLDPIRRDAEFRQMMERFARTHHVSGGRYEGAVDRYEDLLAQDSTDGRAWYQVGSALLAMRDFDRSIDALERATEQLQSDSDALYNTACAYSLRGDTARALDYLERAVLAGFDSDERFRNDADLSEIRKTPRFDEIERLADALSLDRFRSGWGDWGSAYSARRWEPAVVELSEFVKEHPEIGRGWSNLGWALHHSRRHAEAREAFLKQKELGYRPDLAAYNIGCTYAMEDQSDQALDWLGQALDIGPIPVGQLTHDDDLNSLHDDPRFEQLLERAVEDEEDLHHRWGLRKLFDGWNHGKHEIGRSY
jgi:tetratricopeptide (TPR) repeat protein